MTRATAKKLATLILAFCGCTALVHSQDKDAGAADLLVTHGRVYTANPSQPWAEAIAVRGGRILAVGKDEDVQKLSVSGTKVVDAGGRLVLPGFVDCHIHFIDGSLSLGRV